VPRDPKASSLSNLARLDADYRSARDAADRLTEQRRDAIKAAVAAGNTKAAVARIVGVTPARVAALVKE
jgi:hypothetical protein